MLYDAVCEERKRRHWPERPTLQLPQEGRPVGEFAEDAGAGFRHNNVLFYRPVDKSVVKLEMCAIGDDKNKRLLVFIQVKAAEFITLLERYFIVGVNKKGPYSDYFATKSITATMADATLASEYQFRRQLPVLERIFNIRMPCLKDGKLVFPETGYDPVMLSWLPPTAPVIDVNMTVERAKEIILSMYAEFCFASEQDRTNAISALLTPLCRRLYKEETCRTPVYFYKSNRERAGKDYCAGMTGMTYEGCAIEDPPIVSDGETHDDEWRKKILSALKSGRNRIHSSNNKGYLNSPILEGMSTSSYWEDRQLGSNIMLRFPNTLEISISANTGISYTPDLAARCIFINLFFVEEDPNRRVFKTPDLHGWVKENRADVLSALYALIRDWVEKGQVAGSIPFSSYPEWARVVGGIMENAGLGNPCASNNSNDGVGGDKETRNMKLLFELAYAKWPEDWIYKKAVMDEIANQDSDFSDLFGWLDWDGSPKSARTKFGMLLDKFRGRELSGIKLDWIENPTHSTRSQYRFTKDKTPHAPPKVATSATLDAFTSLSHKTTENKDMVEKVAEVTKVAKISQESQTILENTSKTPATPPAIHAWVWAQEGHQALRLDYEARWGPNSWADATFLEAEERLDLIWRPRQGVVKARPAADEEIE